MNNVAVALIAILVKRTQTCCSSRKTKLVFNFASKSIAKKLEKDDLGPWFRIENLKKELSDAFATTSLHLSAKIMKHSISWFCAKLCYMSRCQGTENFQHANWRNYYDNDLNNNIDIVINIGGRSFFSLHTRSGEFRPGYETFSGLLIGGMKHFAF